MHSFRLINPTSKEEALNVLVNCDRTCKLFAGGTDLLPRFREGLCEVPEILINLKSISEFKEISISNSLISVGSMATHSEIADSPVIVESAPVLSEACDKIASWQIRNMGTIGGNLANASPAADSAPALLVLDAMVSLLGAGSVREELKLEDFFIGPGDTVLKNNRIIESLKFFTINHNEGTSFVKLGKRKAMTLSTVSAAAYVKMNANKTVIEKARLAMGAVAPFPRRIKSAEEVLAGFNPALDDWTFLHEAVRSGIKPITDMRSTKEYRLRVAAYIAERAVKIAVERAVANDVKVEGGC